MSKLRRDCEGSFTLEASLVMPVIFVSLFLLLFFCLYFYQQSILSHVAVVAAERSAYVWDNSHRGIRDGSFEAGERDQLYWRLTEDRMLEAIFGLGGKVDAAELQLPVEGNSKDSLAITKLLRVGTEIPAGLEGSVEYRNQLLLRKVSVSLNRFVPFPALERVIGSLRQIGISEAYVVDPVEWIRTVELARYYGGRFKERGDGGMNPSEAGKALEAYGK